MHHFQETNWDEYAHQTDYGPLAHDGMKSGGHPSVPEPFRSIGAIDGSFAPLSDVPYGGMEGRGWVYGRRQNKQLVPFRYANEHDRSLTPDEMNAKWAAARIRRFGEDESTAPFFLAVGFIRPHTPMHVPKRHFDLFPIGTVSVPVIKPGDAEDCHYRDVFYDEHQKGLRYHHLIGESYPTLEDGLKAFTQAYLACVSFVDEQVGVVLEAIELAGLADDTIVILTSDHGFNMGEKDYLFKNSPWEESTRVPLIIRAPGVGEPGSQAEHPVSLIDIYPTLKDLCSLQGDTRKNADGKPLDGHSLRPFLTSAAVGEWPGPSGAVSMIFVGRNPKPGLTDAETWDPARQHWSYRTQRWRYVRYNNGAEELYDHDHDPYEWTNLANRVEYQKQKQTLRRELQALVPLGGDRIERN
jgi:arylsulfatase A-like enzyme